MLTKESSQPQTIAANLASGGNPPVPAGHFFNITSGPCGYPRNGAEEIENARYWAEGEAS